MQKNYREKSFEQLEYVVLGVGLGLGLVEVGVGAGFIPLQLPGWSALLFYLGIFTCTMSIYAFVQLRRMLHTSDTGWEKLLTSWYGFFAFVWSLPVSLLVFVFYLGPALLSRQYRWGRRWGWVMEFSVVPDSWLSKSYWTKWAAHAAGCWVVYRLQFLEHEAIKRHERRHVWQMLVLGIYAPIVWLVHWLVLKAQRKNSYHDHILEEGARRGADKDR